VFAQFFEWKMFPKKSFLNGKLGQKKHTTEESASLILHNFVTTTKQLSNSRHYLLQLGRIDPTNSNMTKTHQPVKTTWSTEHHHPWRSAKADDKRYSGKLDSLAEPSRRKRRQERR